MTQHPNTASLIDMQHCQLQGSSQQTKDNNTDIFYNNSCEMPLCEVECLKSSYVCSALSPLTN